MPALVSLIAALVGCSSSSGSDRDRDAGPDAAGGADAGLDAESPPEGCTEPDRACPAEHPHPGGPCEGALECQYEDEVFSWTYRCEERAWLAEPRCGGGCPTPPLAELCLDPFEDSLENGRLAIGPPSFAETFRPFDEDEVVEPIWGAQGSAMIAFRLELTGVEPPECVLVSTALRMEGSPEQESGDRVRLRCGESLAVYVIVQDSFALCAAGEPVPAELDVEVVGIASTGARLRVQASGCPN